MKRVLSFLKHTIDLLAPYAVRNSAFNKVHFCWTKRQAHEWVAAYPYGITWVLDWQFEVSEIHFGEAW
jgi:hypothetical protein